MQTITLCRWLVGATIAGATASAHADAVTSIGDIAISRTGTDLSGLPATILEDGVSPQNGLNGFGSGIAYTGNGDTYLLLADRGPNEVQ